MRDVRRKGPDKNASRGMLKEAQHLLSHKPDEVCTEDWWAGMLHVYNAMAAIAIEAEKWKLPLEGEAAEPRDAFLAMTRLGIIAMVVSEYYRSQVDEKWFDEKGHVINLLPVKFTPRALAEYGILPNYCECEPRCEGRCVNL